MTIVSSRIPRNALLESTRLGSRAIDSFLRQVPVSIFSLDQNSAAEASFGISKDQSAGDHHDAVKTRRPERAVRAGGLNHIALDLTQIRQRSIVLRRAESRVIEQIVGLSADLELGPVLVLINILIKAQINVRVMRPVKGIARPSAEVGL